MTTSPGWWRRVTRHRDRPTTPATVPSHVRIVDTDELLACGHPDDDPDVWHHNDDLGHAAVCSRCCTLCNPGAA